MDKLKYRTVKNEEFFKATDKQIEQYLFIESPITHIADIAHHHEIYGTYVKYMEGCEGETSYAGLYFVCGLNEKKIRENDFDIAKLIERQRHYPLCTFTQMQAFKIDVPDENFVASNIDAYITSMDLVRYAYSMLGIPVPEVIMTATVYFITEWMMFSRKKDMTSVGQTESLSAVLRCLKDLNKLEDGKKIHEKYKRFCYSGRKRKFWQLDFLRFMLTENPKVSYKTVMCHAVEFATITIEKSLWKDFQNMMKEYPDALYAKLPGLEGIAYIADPQKKVWKRKSDRMNRKINPWAGNEMGISGYDIIFPSHWGDIISFVYNQVKHKKAGGLTQEEVLAEDIYGAFSIPESYFDNFHIECCKNHVKYAFDMGIINKMNFSNIPILVKKNDIDTTHLIINAIYCGYANNIEKLQNVTTRSKIKFHKENEWPECRDFISVKNTKNVIPKEFTGMSDSDATFRKKGRGFFYSDKKINYDRVEMIL